jgi:urease accessory protein
VLQCSIARNEAPIFFRLHAAWSQQDTKAARRWNEFYLASRETAELRAETAQMGYSLSRLLRELGPGEVPLEEPAYPTGIAWATARWDIEPRAALTAFLWSWVEGQVMAAVRAIPLGQTDGQKLALFLANRIDAVVAHAESMADEDIGNWMPALAIFSSWHETQYTRIFRS